MPKNPHGTICGSKRWGNHLFCSSVRDQVINNGQISLKANDSAGGHRARTDLQVLTQSTPSSSHRRKAAGGIETATCLSEEHPADLSERRKSTRTPGGPDRYPANQVTESSMAPSERNDTERLLLRHAPRRARHPRGGTPAEPVNQTRVREMQSGTAPATGLDP